jgi:flagellar assembly factor FliW
MLFTTDSAMEIFTTRFGSLKISQSDRICFATGLPGFEDCRDWVLLAYRPESELGWLQSTVWPDLAVPVVNPRVYVPSYDVRLDPAELSPLGLDSPADAQILAIVARHGDFLTLNLKAPLAINLRRQLGRQVLNNGAWSVHHVVTGRPVMLRKSA